jgi:hypothetical protein
MDNYQRFGQIAAQFYIGVGFGLIGAIIALIIADLYYNRLDLFGTGVYFYIGFYIGNQVGIGFIGLRFLKKLGRRNEFYKYFGLSVIGMILAQVITYYSFFHIVNSLSLWMAYFVGLILTLGGPMLGFNIKLINTV